MSLGVILQDADGYLRITTLLVAIVIPIAWFSVLSLFKLNDNAFVIETKPDWIPALIAHFS